MGILGFEAGYLIHMGRAMQKHVVSVAKIQSF